MTVVAIVAAVLVVCGDGWGSVMGMTPDVGRRDVGVGGDGDKASVERWWVGRGGDADGDVPPSP